MDQPPPVPSTNTAPAERRRFPWLLFLTVIFLPTIITVLAVQFHMRELAPVSAVVGGGGSALVGGWLLARHLGSTDGKKAALAVLFIMILGVACIAMNCFGCLASGFKVDFR